MEFKISILRYFYVPINELYGIINISRGEFQGCGEWSGVQSLPRIIDIKNKKLSMIPVKELEILRSNHEKYEDLIIFGNSKKINQ